MRSRAAIALCAGVLAELASDPRLVTAEKRCAVFDHPNDWEPRVAAASSASDLGCGATF